MEHIVNLINLDTVYSETAISGVIDYVDLMCLFGFHHRTEFLLFGYKGKLKMLMTRMIGLDPSKTGILNSVQHDNNVYKFEPIFVYYKK